MLQLLLNILRSLVLISNIICLFNFLLVLILSNSIQEVFVCFFNIYLVLCPDLALLKLKLQYFGYLMERAKSLEKTLILGLNTKGERGGRE